MPKIKTSKEFAIKLIHPDFGEFYFSYFGWNNTQHHYVFVQNLSKVSKWKTTKFAEKQVKIMQDNLKNERGKIMLSFGSDIDDSLKPLMTVSKRKYYLPITDIKILSDTTNATENIRKNNEEFKNTSGVFLDSFKNIQDDLVLKLKDYILDNNASMENINIDKYLSDVKLFVKNTNILSKSINTYLSNKKVLEESARYNGSYLDIVDASYNFRGLKLKTLKTIDED